MTSSSSPRTARRAANISLDPQLIADARALDINISRACEAGLQAQIKKAREERWRAENREALESSNRYVEEHGLPLARFRQF
jgi:antitoxin CcdA